MKRYTRVVKPRGYSVQTAATADPVTLADAREHLRIDTTDEDGVISTYIQAATQRCQQFQRRQYINATYDFKFDCWGDELLIPIAPLVSVESITYIDLNGSEQTLSTDYYKAITDQEPGRVVNKFGVFWPAARSEEEAITVRAVVGYGTDASSVPATARSAILMFVHDLFTDRGEHTELRLEDNRAALALLWIDKLPEFA